MTKTGIKISNVVIGDAFAVKRPYTTNVTATLVSKAYLTIKKRAKDPDSAALVQKMITTSASAHGQITDNNPADGGIALTFNFSSPDTINAKPIAYFYDVRIIMASGDPHTMETGTIEFIKGYTAATS